MRAAKVQGARVGAGGGDTLVGSASGRKRGRRGVAVARAMRARAARWRGAMCEYVTGNGRYV
eukprot:1788830-Prymnesium_polylepis.1